MSSNLLHIGVDVDGPVFDTGGMWLEWLCNVTKTSFCYGPEERLDYNYTKYFKGELEKLGMDGFEFWRSRTLYDNLTPVEGCVEALKAIHEMGYKIFFVSTIKGDHTKSKYYALKKVAPFMSGYIATKEKWAVDIDVLIDDSIDNLEKVREESRACSETILWSAPHNRGYMPLRGMNNWNEIMGYLNWRG